MLKIIFVKLTPSPSLSKRGVPTLKELALKLNLIQSGKLEGKLVTPLLEREGLGVSLNFIFFITVSLKKFEV